METAPLPYDQWGQSGKYFEWKNHNIFYHSGGKGQTLVMLHGFPTSNWDWCWVTPVLLNRFYLVQPDFLDYGRSLNAYDSPASIMDQADMVEALLQHRGIKTAHILAHDIGDTVAQELLARHNESALSFQLESCTFMNGGIVPGLHKPLMVQRLLASSIGKYMIHMISRKRLLKSFQSVFGKTTRPEGALLDAFWPTIVGVNGRRSIIRRIHYITDRKKHGDRWMKAISEAYMPLFMICGIDDPVSGGVMADGFSKLSPKAKIARLPGIGHYPHCEAPETVVDLIEQFHDCIVEKQAKAKLAPAENNKIDAHAKHA